MKFRKIPFLSYIIFFMICWGGGDASESEREKRLLNYKYNAGVEGLNFEHIISLWNRSASASEEPPMSQRWSMPSDRREIPSSVKISTTTTTTAAAATPTTTTTTERSREEKFSASESFPERFKHCIGQQQKRVVEGGLQGQNLIVKCFKSELVSKLHGLLANSDSSIKLFNGYLEFEKIGKKRETQVEDINPSRKRYSARVNSDAKSHSSPDSYVRVPARQAGPVRTRGGHYYENYQKMLKELVARKVGNDRSKREIPNDVAEEKKEGETLKKTARLFENGRKLISEISNNLENEEEEVENLTQTIMDPELVSALNTFTRNYAVKLNFYPGISARMKRNQNNGVTFDLELDELSGEDDDDDDDEEEEDDGAGRGDKKKKKKKIKISKKTLKKLFPYLLIPFMIQAALLPFVLKFLLFVAIKALIAGKLALVLVAFNVLKNAGHKHDDDEYGERMAVEHYGYGNGEEYGAWINRRAIQVPEDDEARKMNNDPYRAHAPREE